MRNPNPLDAGVDAAMAMGDMGIDGKASLEERNEYTEAGAVSAGGAVAAVVVSENAPPDAATCDKNDCGAVTMGDAVKPDDNVSLKVTEGLDALKNENDVDPAGCAAPKAPSYTQQTLEIT